MVAAFGKINEQVQYWRSDYYIITAAEDSRNYTAFATQYGKYKFLWVPFAIYVV